MQPRLQRTADRCTAGALNLQLPAPRGTAHAVAVQARCPRCAARCCCWLPCSAAYFRLPTPTRPFLLQLRGMRQLRGGAWAVQDLQLLQGSAVLRRGLPGGALEGGAQAGVQVRPG